jgi:hypothetical protein
VSSRLLRRVAFVKTDVSEERRFLQEPHGVTAQKTPFLTEVCLSPKSNARTISEALGFTQPLTEMSTRSIKIMFLGSKAAAGA